MGASKEDEIVLKIKADISDVNKKFKQVEQGAEELGGKSSRSFNKAGKATGFFSGALSKMTGAVMGGLAAYKLMSIALMAVVNAFKAVMEQMFEIDKAIASLGAKFGKSVDEMQSLSDEARALARGTQYTTVQVLHLMEAFAKLGLTEQEIKEVTKSVVDLAIATGTDLVQAGDTAVKSLNAFGLSTKDASSVMAILAVATTKTAIAMSDFNVLMSNVGPAADAAGFSLRETVAMFGILKDAGFKASKAAIALRSIFLRLADPTSKLSELIGGGIHSLYGMTLAMETATKAGVGLTEVLEATDKRTVSAMLQLMKNGDELMVFMEQLKVSADDLAIISANAADNISTEWDVAKSAWAGAMDEMSREGTFLYSVVDIIVSGIRLVGVALHQVILLLRAGYSAMALFNAYIIRDKEAVTRYIEEIKKYNDITNELFYGTYVSESDREKLAKDNAESNLLAALAQKKFSDEVAKTTAKIELQRRLSLASGKEKIAIYEELKALNAGFLEDALANNAAQRAAFITERDGLTDVQKIKEVNLLIDHNITEEQKIKNKYALEDIRLQKLITSLMNRKGKASVDWATRLAKIQDKIFKQGRDRELGFILDVNKETFIDIKRLEKYLDENLNDLADSMLRKAEAASIGDEVIAEFLLASGADVDIFQDSDMFLAMTDEEKTKALIVFKEYVDGVITLEGLLAEAGVHNDEAEDIRWKKKIERIEDYARSIGSVFGATADLMGNVTDHQLAKELESAEKRNASEKEIDAIKQEYAEKQFNRTKYLRYGETVMNTAAAVMGHLVNPGGIPGYIMAGADVILGAAQATAISSEKFGSIGGSGGGGSVSTPSVSNTAPVTSGEALYSMGKQAEPLQAFVVQSDLEIADRTRGYTDETVNL